jgi:hypothetical protein
MKDRVERILEIIDREESLLRRKAIDALISKYTVLEVYDEIKTILKEYTHTYTAGEEAIDDRPDCD